MAPRVIRVREESRGHRAECRGGATYAPSPRAVAGFEEKRAAAEKAEEDMAHSSVPRRSDLVAGSTRRRMSSLMYPLTCRR